MTNEELLDVVKMRLDGHTLAEIGEKYGMTVSGIAREIKSISGRDSNEYRGQARVYNQIIYPSIRARMEVREWTLVMLSEKSCVKYATLCKILYGDTQRPRIKSKTAIAKALDMSVEEAFGKVKLDGE